MRAAAPLAITLALFLSALAGVAAGENALLDAPLKGPNNTTVTLRTMLGKPLVVEFMASWCPACARQMEELKLLRGRYGGNVTIVSVSVDPVSDTPEKLAELAAEEGADWLFLVDESGRLVAHLGIYLIPRILVLDARGDVVADYTGLVSASTLAEAIESASAPRTLSLHLPSLLVPAAAGAATVLSPCVIPLLPGYMALWLSKRRSTLASVAGAVLTGVGVVATFAAVLAAALFIGGAFAGVAAKAAGVIVASLGVAQLIQAKKLLISIPVPGSLEKLGLLGYGIAYGLASLGCSFPIFLSIAIYSASLGEEGVTYAASYVAGAFASVSIAGLVGAKAGAKLSRVSHIVQLIAGALMIAAGAYLLAS